MGEILCQCLKAKENDCRDVRELRGGAVPKDRQLLKGLRMEGISEGYMNAERRRQGCMGT